MVSSRAAFPNAHDMRLRLLLALTCPLLFATCASTAPRPGAPAAMDEKDVKEALARAKVAVPDAAQLTATVRAERLMCRP